MASEKVLDLVVPKIGEGIVEVIIVKWLKNLGDSFDKNESLVEIATDKVDSEISAPFSGVLKSIVVQEGYNAKVGSSIAWIDVLEEPSTDGFITKAASTHNNEKQASKVCPKSFTEEPSTDSFITKASSTHKNGKQDFKTEEKIINKYCSPIAYNIAKNANLDIEQIRSLIRRKGDNNKITKKDILEYLQRKDSIKKTNFESDLEIKLDINKEDKIVKLDRIRSITAQKMALANNTIPHVTSFVGIDITDVLKWRLKVKPSFLKKYGVSLTLTPLFIWAIAKALKKFPTINSHFNSKDLLVNKKEINIGMAVALKDNNLIVPVIKNAETLSLPELANIINDLSSRARKKRLMPTEVIGTTFSVSNIGVFKTSMGTPIITPPQVAVLAIGSINNRLAFAEDKKTIEERSIVTLCHTYDHRVIDGALGGIFANEVGVALQQIVEMNL